MKRAVVVFAVAGFSIFFGLTQAHSSENFVEGKRCDVHKLDYTDRTSQIILNQIERARAEKRFCSVAKHYFELDLQHPDVARKVHSTRQAIEALAKGNYVREAIQQFMDLLEYNIAHPDREHILYILAQTTYNNLPAQACTMPSAASSAPGDVGYSALQEAIDLADSFLLQFPKSQYRETVEKLRDDMENFAAEQEICVAEFYQDQARITEDARYLRAALMRYEGVINVYASTPSAGKALQGAIAASQSLSSAKGLSESEKQSYSKLSEKFQSQLKR